jgi:hypothetical protein
MNSQDIPNRLYYYALLNVCGCETRDRCHALEVKVKSLISLVRFPYVSPVFYLCREVQRPNVDVSGVLCHYGTVSTPQDRGDTALSEVAAVYWIRPFCLPDQHSPLNVDYQLDR